MKKSTISLHDDVISSYLSSLDCPRALTVEIMYRYNEHDQIVQLDCLPIWYAESESFQLAYYATKFLSKSTFLSTNIDKRKVALDSFRTAEQQCRETNQRIVANWDNPSIAVKLQSAIIRKIDSILGEFRGEELIDSAGWGPGVTTLIKGDDTSATNKFRIETGTTHLLHELMGDLYAIAYPHWSFKPTFEMGNQIITVPKNSKTDRTIAIEPGLNLWFQKGAGTMIRRRLRRVRCDLSSQERNQKLARLGSRYQRLATVDFSSASDTISLRTVERLLPQKWFTVLGILRSASGLIDNERVIYEKFSSMGNGYTFELESLIFYSIALCCCEAAGVSGSEVSVYGDDVIIPVEALDLFRDTCKYYGFSINNQKSFSDGYFRESCGAYWWNGVNCKPYFFKEALSSIDAKIKMANSIRRLASYRDYYFPFCDKRFLDVYSTIISSIPKSSRFWISDGYGDLGLISNFDEACPQKAKHGIEGYYVRLLGVRPKAYETDNPALLLARLRYCSEDMSLGNQVPYRGRVRRIKTRLHVKQWVNLGPWI